VEYIAAAITIIMVMSAPFLNREIGDGDGGAFKTRLPVFGIWIALTGLLALSVLGFTLSALYCTLILGGGYIIFRQIISPAVAFFAGHGSIEHEARTKWIVEKLAILFFNYDRSAVHISKKKSIDYGVKVGGLVGFLKVFLGWGLLGLVFCSTLCLPFSILGIFYGRIHKLWGQDLAGTSIIMHWSGKKRFSSIVEVDMRAWSERTVGLVIIAPNTIIPIWFYDGGLLTYFGGM